MSIQERILQYIDFKSITPYKFCKDLGFSMGYLDKRGAIGTDKYLKIIEYFTDINPEWLLMGRGEMLKSEIKPTNENDGYIIELQRHRIKSLENEVKDHKLEIERLKKELSSVSSGKVGSRGV